MSKMMGGLIEAIDGFMPGYKTYVCWVVAMGMMGCQMMGYHHFTPEMWGMVGINATVSYTHLKLPTIWRV